MEPSNALDVKKKRLDDLLTDSDRLAWLDHKGHGKDSHRIEMHFLSLYEGTLFHSTVAKGYGQDDQPRFSAHQIQSFMRSWKKTVKKGLTEHIHENDPATVLRILNGLC